ncbi:T9SS type A sorting domain-containing protein [Pseudopedobacter beijingensis]|uniref:T9SS type A sorting domain-containing protein n=1 Tax=Pseudopedobacter beijingensis TaxID=1207056 RepID=A0ABW4I970_9SPHI
MREIYVFILLMNMISLKVMSQVNLSQEGTANSYIVTELGFYSFKATKGNSTATLSNMGSAAWLWMSKADLISNVSYDVNSGMVSFNASNERGNVVIAGFDAGGNIVWSWHIWLTDDPRLNLHKVQSFYIMDRNLGAIANVEEDVKSYGLYYQWGRKDPFLGAKDLGSKASPGNETTAFSTATEYYIVNPLYVDRTFSAIANNDVSIPVGKSVDYAIANPTKFISYVGQVNSSSLGDWLNSEQIDNLWGFAGIDYNIATSKSIYDPCPLGFKVGHSGKKVFWVTDPGTGTPRLSQNPNIRYMEDTRSFVFPYENKDYYYPASGYRDDVGKLTSVGNDMWIWSSIRSDLAENNKWGAQAFRVYRNANVSPIAEYYTNQTERTRRARGNPCRCIKDDDPALPIKWGSLKIGKDNNGVKLNWTTLSEINNSHFNVLRSIDGVQFTPIGRINANKEQSYQFIDLQPNVGYNYYQLEQVDFDEKTDLSDPIAINFSSENERFSVYAPLEGDYVQVMFTNEKLGKKNIQIIDASGRLLLNSWLNLEIGQNIIELPVSLQKGVYIAKIGDTVTRFVK